MSKARVVVLEVTSGHLSVTAAARAYGLSRQHIYRLLSRYRDGGLDAVEPRSRRPASNPHTVGDEVIAAVVLLREHLTADGLDAGPLTLQGHLAQQGLPVPSTSTIRRILHHHGLITPQPRKRPRSSYRRFQAEQPNECWQSDFTHWTLLDGTDVEILNWLDDHSRYLLSCTAHRRVTGPDVVATFTTTAAKFGLPASTLTDNGAVYTSRFTHGHNDFERLLASLGITQKNGHPDHPQTQGKIERFHQTLKRWLSATTPTRPPWPNYKPCSTPSAPSTTPNEPTAPTPATPHPTGLPRPPQSPTHQPSHRTLPRPPRHRRPIRQTHPAPRQPPAPPRHRHYPRPHPSADPGRRHHRHRDQQNQPPGPQQPPHRPRQKLLAQPKQKPRPMAGESVTHVATQL